MVYYNGLTGLKHVLESGIHPFQAGMYPADGPNFGRFFRSLLIKRTHYNMYETLHTDLRMVAGMFHMPSECIALDHQA